MAEIGTWAEAEEFARTRVRAATPKARLAWMQQLLALAHTSGAVPSSQGQLVGDFEAEAFERIRQTCLGFGDVARADLQGRPLFRVGKRRFAIFNSSWSPERPRWAGQGCSLHFLADPAESDALRADPRFSPSPHHGERGWFALRLDTDTVDWDEVAELLASAHAQVTKGSKYGSS